MDFKAIGLKFLKGAFSGALASFGTLQMVGGLTGSGAMKAAGFAVLSAAIHAGSEAVNQSKA